ncbi:MAG: hypothetical protein V7K89_05310 [Nostoc sp.]
MPGDDDFLLAFTWSGTIEGEPPEHELIAISVQDIVKEVTVALGRFLFIYLETF